MSPKDLESLNGTKIFIAECPAMNMIIRSWLWMTWTKKDDQMKPDRTLCGMNIFTLIIQEDLSISFSCCDTS